MNVRSNPASMLDRLRRVSIDPPLWYSALCVVLWITLIHELFHLGKAPHAGVMFPPPLDKVVHFIFYGGITAIMWIALRAAAPYAETLAPISTCMVGVVDELVQSVTPGRSAGLDDLAADVLGATVAVLILLRWRRRVRADDAAGTAPPGR